MFEGPKLTLTVYDTKSSSRFMRLIFQILLTLGIFLFLLSCHLIFSSGLDSSRFEMFFWGFWLSFAGFAGLKYRNGDTLDFYDDYMIWYIHKNNKPKIEYKDIIDIKLDLDAENYTKIKSAVRLEITYKKFKKEKKLIIPGLNESDMPLQKLTEFVTKYKEAHQINDTPFENK